MKYLLPFLLFILYGCALPVINKVDLVAENEERRVKIVQLTDLHIIKEKELFSATMHKVHTIKPDIVVFTGDMIESSGKIDLLIQYIKICDLECPKYAILGNWEYWGNVDIGKLKEKLNSVGVILLF